MKKINYIDILNIKPENGIFFSKDEFYSTLKGSALGDDEYNNSKNTFYIIKNERFVQFNSSV